MDIFNATMLAEEGDVSDPEVIEAWQLLVDKGVAWQLQGWFARTARDLIDQGEVLAFPRGTVERGAT